jgi:[acyl-carrier-protein] S-malonyltransferase
MTKIGIIFPGQGSQKVGMGQDILSENASTKALFEEASKILGTDIKKLCLEGPQEELTLTKNAQPAIFLVSFALFKCLEAKGIRPSIIAGHSLGELTAYTAGGILSFKDTVKVIKKRGDEMNRAAAQTQSGMAAIMGKAPAEIETLLAPYQNDPVVIANYNCPGQIVISGEKTALEKACADLKNDGAKVIPLPVSGAFHSPLMKPASVALETYLNEFEFSDAKTPIILNRTANKETSKSNLKENISKQVISSVQWIKSIEEMSKEVDIILECGPGRVLSGLVKKIDREIIIKTINSLDAINELEL